MLEQDRIGRRQCKVHRVRIDLDRVAEQNRERAIGGVVMLRSLHREHNVIGGEWRAVMKGDSAPQFETPVQRIARVMTCVPESPRTQLGGCRDSAGHGCPRAMQTSVRSRLPGRKVTPQSYE